MKLLADLLSIKRLKDYQADGVIIADSEYSCFPRHSFTFEEVKEIVSSCKENHKTAVLNIDAIIGEDELFPFFKKLEKYLELGIDYYIFGDFSVFTFFRERNEEERLIYDPKTLIASRGDAAFYKNLGLKVAISSELSLEEILEVAEAGNGMLEIYGHHQIFYSKRSLISNFFEHSGLAGVSEGVRYSLKEETREDEYPIIQEGRGTFIYTSYRFALIDELPLLKEKLLFGRINTAFLEESEALQIISLYKEALAGDAMETKKLQEKLVSINPNIGRGFLDKKSVLLKEES
jgi:putative protease